MGLIERDAPNSSYRHVISLEEAGIEVPPIPDPEEEEEKTEQAEGTESEEESVAENEGAEQATLGGD